MLNHETSPSSVTDLNCLLEARIKRNIDLVRIQQAEDLNTPAIITLGGRLYGYDPFHSVAVELKGCVDKKLGTIYGIRICDDKTSLEEYCVSEQAVFNLQKDQILDSTEVQELFFWVEQTKWDEYHTRIFTE
jgi:hypothetical protein